MPADVPGVTTDDQAPPASDGGDPTLDASSPEAATSAEALAAQGLPTPASAPNRAERSERTGVPTGVRSPRSAGGGTNGDGQPAGPDVRAGSTGARGSGLATDPTAAPPAEPATNPASIPDPAGIPDPGPMPGGLPGGAPPPAPVLLEAGRRQRRRLRRRRADRAARRGLRVTQRLWSIDVWSVFKVSALFYLCMGLIILVAGTLLYNAGREVGTIDQFESFITRMGAYGDCVPKAEVPAGTEFEEDDACDEGEVLVGGFALDDGTLFRVAAIGGGVLVVAGSIGTVLLTVLVNLLNEITGGLRHTVIREPVVRPPGAGPGVRPAAPERWRVRAYPGPPGERAPAPTGSPRPRVRG
jgi:Transmembrane domain of unknown function (DUF3566)